MARKGFIHKLAITILIMIITIIPSNVFAKMDGVVLKDNSGRLYNFDYEKLKDSLADDGLLYMKFKSLRDEGSEVYSYHDDIQGKYVLRSDLLDAFSNSAGNFNARYATETLNTTEMPSVIYNQVENPDGTISEIPMDENDFDVIDIH